MFCILKFVEDNVVMLETVKYEHEKLRQKSWWCYTLNKVRRMHFLHIFSMLKFQRITQLRKNFHYLKVNHKLF